MCFFCILQTIKLSDEILISGFYACLKVNLSFKAVAHEWQNVQKLIVKVMVCVKSAFGEQ